MPTQSLPTLVWQISLDVRAWKLCLRSIVDLSLWPRGEAWTMASPRNSTTAPFVDPTLWLHREARPIASLEHSHACIPILVSQLASS